MRERTVRTHLHRLVLDELREGGTIVDVGCGTGRSAIALARLRPDATVIGVDGDPEILLFARAKAGAQHVQWIEGLADTLPIGDATADRVVLSLVLHHLPPAGKRAALREVSRVLRPGGRLAVADWGPPRGVAPRVGFALLRVLDGVENTRDHAAGRIPGLLSEAGLSLRSGGRRVPTPFGTLELLPAVRPAA
jgi:ubiquinone/menaquinone biosynthesis C-methylase UbiE